MCVSMSWTRLLELSPIGKTVCHFDSTVRDEAAAKFRTLWFFSVLPIVLAGAASLFQAGTGLRGLLTSLDMEFSSTSVLVYAVSYLVPFMYIYIDKASLHEKFSFTSKKLNRIHEFPPRYKFFACLALVVLIVSVFTFKRGGSASMNNVPMPWSLWIAKWVVYLFSVTGWYLTILIEMSAAPSVAAAAGNFSKSTKDGEQKAKSEYTEELNKESGQ